MNFCANLPTFASKPSYEPGSQVHVEIWTLSIDDPFLWPTLTFADNGNVVLGEDDEEKIAAAAETSDIGEQTTNGGK